MTAVNLITTVYHAIVAIINGIINKDVETIVRTRSLRAVHGRTQGDNLHLQLLAISAMLHALGVRDQLATALLALLAAITL